MVLARIEALFESLMQLAHLSAGDDDEALAQLRRSTVDAYGTFGFDLNLGGEHDQMHDPTSPMSPRCPRKRAKCAHGRQVSRCNECRAHTQRNGVGGPATAEQTGVTAESALRCDFCGRTGHSSDQCKRLHQFTRLHGGSEAVATSTTAVCEQPAMERMGVEAIEVDERVALGSSLDDCAADEASVRAKGATATATTVAAMAMSVPSASLAAQRGGNPRLSTAAPRSAGRVIRHVYVRDWPVAPISRVPSLREVRSS